MSALVATLDFPVHRWSSLATFIEQHARVLGVQRDFLRARWGAESVEIVVGVHGAPASTARASAR
jgi:hypothetical protein